MASLNTAALAPASMGYSSSAVAPTLVTPAAPEPIPAAGAQVRFVSPVIDIDPEAGLALLKVRDTESGEVEFQVPAEKVVKEYRTAQDSVPQAPARAERSDSAAPAQTATVSEPKGTFEPDTAKSGSSDAQ